MSVVGLDEGESKRGIKEMLFQGDVAVPQLSSVVLV